MHRPSAFVLALALSCHTARRPTTPITHTAPTTESAAATAPEGTELIVRAREAPRMPRCTADDALAVGSLAEGIAATPALARRDDGGLVVYVQDHDHDGHADLGFLALDSRGAPAVRGEFTLTDTGEEPSYPALVTTDTGYLLVWRRGASGHQSLASRAFDAHGAPRGPVTSLSQQGSLGAPALLWANGSAVVAIARDTSGDRDPRSATHIDVLEGSRPLRSVAAPEGTRFDTSAPVLVNTPTGLRAFTMLSRARPAAHDERALVRLLDSPARAPTETQDPPTLIARDLDHPTARLTPTGVLLAWRARVARRDSALRSVLIPENTELTSAPITLATFRGAYGAEVALAEMGQHRVGALSVSTLGDDSVGSLNLSLLDDRGDYIGRAPVLTGFLTRSAHIAVASLGADTWIAIDGRDTDGSGPELLITHLRCDDASPVERLDLPPATFVQDINNTEPAALSLASAPSGGSAAMTCTPRGSGGFVTHHGDGLSNSSAAVVQVGPNALLLAVAKLDERPPSLSYTWVDARGHSPPARRVIDAAEEILAAQPVANGALAVVRYVFRDIGRTDMVMFRAGGVSHGLIPSGMRDPTSAAVVTETGAVFVTASTEAGTPWLFRVNTTHGTPATPVAIAQLRPGDRVQDALRRGSSTDVLLARPDALDPEVGQSIARLSVPDGAIIARDPFTDPIGHPRGAVLWATRTTPSVLYSEREVLREAAIEGGQIARAQSLMNLLPGGANVLAAAWSGPERWVALATGRAGETAPQNTRAITLVVLGTDGAVRGVNTRVPDDAGAADEAAAMAVSGRRVVLLYPRVSGTNAVEWAYTDQDCGAVR